MNMLMWWESLFRSIGGEISQDGDFQIFESNRYRGGFLYKTLAMSAIVSFGSSLLVCGLGASAWDCVCTVYTLLLYCMTAYSFYSHTCTARLPRKWFPFGKLCLIGGPSGLVPKPYTPQVPPVVLPVDLLSSTKYTNMVYTNASLVGWGQCLGLVWQIWESIQQSRGRHPPLPLLLVLKLLLVAQWNIFRETTTRYAFA